MIWAIVAILVGLALGVALVLVLARPDSIRSAHKAAPDTKRAPGKAAATTAKAKRSQRRTSSEDLVVRAPEPLVPFVQVTASHDTPPGPDRPVDFSEAALRAAWRRQGGLCAQCGRLLIWANRNRDSGIGAWQSHHRIPRDQGGTSDLRNCVLFCSGTANCHFNVGHGGIGWNHYSALEDSALLYLRHGPEKASGTGPQSRPKPGLIRQVFGIGGPRKGKRRPASKPRTNRSPLSLPPQDDYDEAY